MIHLSIEEMLREADKIQTERNCLNVINVLNAWAKSPKVRDMTGQEALEYVALKWREALERQI